MAETWNAIFEIPALRILIVAGLRPRGIHDPVAAVGQRAVGAAGRVGGVAVSGALVALLDTHSTGAWQGSGQAPPKGSP